MLKIRYLFIQLMIAFLAFLIPLHLYSSKILPDLEFSVEVKDESCSSDGELTFLVNPTDPSASITYHIFINPELTLPFKVQTETTLSNLSAGEYRIIATQELDGDSQSKQVDVTIKSSYVPTEFQIISEDICRRNDGKIRVKINAGTASTFQIQGPVNSGPQTDNELRTYLKGIILFSSPMNVEKGIPRVLPYNNLPLPWMNQELISIPSFPVVEKFR